ncbi:orotate phosphoribosyltransferase [Cryomorphaceae bacterium 1068]|nr:orotate phosphoribosyltransferase [Cryomorphaceae bacterium 1068]
MQNTQTAEQKIAESLLKIKAVKLSPSDPFTWASGWKSPIYCDNRQTLSFPEVRLLIRDEFVRNIREKFGNTEVIAGVATGGIAHGALVAESLGLPFIYVRSSSKGHGLQNKVEGYFEKGQKVMVIEDLVSTGKSSLDAVEALKAAGVDVIGMAAIFTYGFEIAKENFAKANCDLITLSNYSALIEEAKELNYVDEESLQSLKEWRSNPQNWSA